MHQNPHRSTRYPYHQNIQCRNRQNCLHHPTASASDLDEIDSDLAAKAKRKPEFQYISREQSQSAKYRHYYQRAFEPSAETLRQCAIINTIFTFTSQVILPNFKVKNLLPKNLADTLGWTIERHHFENGNKLISHFLKKMTEQYSFSPPKCALGNFNTLPRGWV